MVSSTAARGGACRSCCLWSVVCVIGICVLCVSPFVPVAAMFSFDYFEAKWDRFVLRQPGHADIAFVDTVDRTLGRMLGHNASLVDRQRVLSLALGLDTLPRASLHRLWCVSRSRRSDLPLLGRILDASGWDGGVEQWNDASSLARISRALLQHSAVVASYSPVPVLTACAELLTEAAVASGAARLDRDGKSIVIGENEWKNGGCDVDDGNGEGARCVAIPASWNEGEMAAVGGVKDGCTRMKGAQCDALGIGWGQGGPPWSREQKKTFLCDTEHTTTLLGASLFQNEGEWTKVPALVHQTWKDVHMSGIAEIWKVAFRSWLPPFPPLPFTTASSHSPLSPPVAWVRVVWSDDALPAIVRLVTSLHPAYNPSTFASYPFVIQKVDAVRYSILLALGGIYSDLDIVMRRFAQDGHGWPKALTSGAILPRTNPFGLSQDLLFSSPGHPLFARFVRKLDRHAIGTKLLAPFSKFLTVMLATGPWFVSWQEWVQSAVECPPLSNQHPSTLSPTPPSQYPTYPDWWRARLLDSQFYEGGRDSLVGHVQGGSWHDEESKFYWETMQAILDKGHRGQLFQRRAIAILVVVLCVLGCVVCVLRLTNLSSLCCTCTPYLTSPRANRNRRRARTLSTEHRESRTKFVTPPKQSEATPTSLQTPDGATATRRRYRDRPSLV